MHLKIHNNLFKYSFLLKPANVLLILILFNSFSQKTEEASIILDEIVGLDSYEDQVVVLASILGILRQEQKRVYDAIREMVEQISE